jgi:uncharacterized protein
MTIPGTSDRYFSLDAMRGFAVMGILAMNIIAFAYPEMAYLTPAFNGPPTQTNIASWAFSFIVVDGKMRGIFSLLFGVSMLLIAGRAEAKGDNAAKVHLSRMFWLALFGLAHFLFIWWGDILFLYAIIGSVAWCFRDMDSPALIRTAIFIYTIGFILMALLMGAMWLLQFAANAPNADAEFMTAYQEMMAEFAKSSGEMEIYRSSYAEILNYRLTEKWDHPITMVIQNIFETLPYMMIGMALYKNGFITGGWSHARYRKWALTALAVGGSGYAFFAVTVIISGFDLVLLMNIALAWTYPLRLIMILGYVASCILLIKAYAKSAFIARVAAAGRVAFSNYLGTSILMTTLFYGYGLGLYGHISRPMLWLFVFACWAVMLLWSKPWLDHFQYGPLEWLWRSLARGQIQPMRRLS